MWNFLKKPNSGIWNPQPGDQFTLDDLQEYKVFLEHDLSSAKSDYVRWDAFLKKYPNLTQSKKGFKGMLLACKRAIFEAEKNLITVNRLISEFK